ncbi:hypothetical protein JKP88DRAFT_324315 [Tribonema minus]|uniref:BTB domain-containing protein n=1 Tax=Tribonema minus TaxID=303371 RepID=A0A836CBJ3_9STRA|nr:hypothetical protein JKP88DRAFT_324315 [Tribonema minus]
MDAKRLASMWDDPQLKDVVVNIVHDHHTAQASAEEPSESAAKRLKRDGGGPAKEGVYKQLLLHATVLSAASSYFDATLRISEEPGSQYYALPITVSSEQEGGAVEDMLRSIYISTVPSDMSIDRALGVLQAAYKSDVSEVISRYSTWVSLQPEVDEECAATFFDLSEDIRERITATFSKVAYDKVCNDLFDIEKTMIDDRLRTRLLALPQDVIAKFLDDDRTKTTHKNSVVSLLVHWAIGSGHRTVPDELAHCVRLLSVSPVYLGASCSFFPLRTVPVVALLTMAYAHEGVSKQIEEDNIDSGERLGKALTGLEGSEVGVLYPPVGNDDDAADLKRYTQAQLTVLKYTN